MIEAVFGLIGDPLIDSIKIKRSLPPSRAGNGNKFIIARFIDISAVIITTKEKPI